MFIDPRGAPYNCVADGVTDNTVGLNAAIADAISSNQMIGLAGLFGFTGTLTINAPLKVFGTNCQSSGLIGTGGPTQPMINVQTNEAVNFENFFLGNSVPMTGGYGVWISGSGTSPQNNFSTFQDIVTSNLFTAFNFQSAAYWLMRNVKATYNAANGTVVTIRNTTTPDAGDATIDNLSVYGGAGVTGVRWSGGGGLRLINSKLLQIQTGIWCNPDPGVNTGIIFICTNSFDGCTANGISIDNYYAGTGYGNIVVSENIFTGLPPSVANIYGGKSMATGCVLDGVIIATNHFNDGAVNVNMTNVTNVTLGPNGAN